MKIFIQYIISLLLLAGVSHAQKVQLSYAVQSDKEGTVVSVYAESATASSMDISAINLSFAYNEGCEVIGEIESLLLDNWTDYLAREKQAEDLELKAGGQLYTRRYQWGIADPGLPQTSMVILPPAGEAMLVLTKRFVGECKDIYMEHVSENSLNEIGDRSMAAMTYRIIHPNRPSKELKTVTLSAFPNPVIDWVTLVPEGLEDGVYVIEILDLMGRSLYSESKEYNTDNELRVNMSGLASGVYIVNILQKGSGDQATAIRLLKE